MKTLKKIRSSFLFIVLATVTILAEDVILKVDGGEVYRQLPTTLQESNKLVLDMATMFNKLSDNYQSLELKYKDELEKNGEFIKKVKNQVDTIELLIVRYDSLMAISERLEARSLTLQDSLSGLVKTMINESRFRIWNCGIGVAYTREKDKRDIFAVTPWVSYRKIAIGPVFGTEYGVYIGYSMW